MTEDEKLSTEFFSFGKKKDVSKKIDIDEYNKLKTNLSNEYKKIMGISCNIFKNCLKIIYENVFDKDALKKHNYTYEKFLNNQSFIKFRPINAVLSRLDKIVNVNWKFKDDKYYEKYGSNNNKKYFSSAAIFYEGEIKLKGITDQDGYKCLKFTYDENGKPNGRQQPFGFYDAICKISGSKDHGDWFDTDSISHLEDYDIPDISLAIMRKINETVYKSLSESVKNYGIISYMSYSSGEGYEVCYGFFPNFKVNNLEQRQKSEESTEEFSETKKTINEIIPEYLSQISDEIASREAVSKKFNNNYDTVIIIRYDGKSKWDGNCMAIQLVYENNDWNVNNTSVSKVFNKKEIEEALSHCKNKQKSNAKVLVLANENNELRDVLTELNCEFKSLYEILPDRLKKTYPLLTVGEPGSPYPNSQKNMNIDISFFYKAFGNGKIKSLEDLYMSTESFIDMGSLLKGFTSTHETDTEAKKKTKIFKCPVCKKKYNSAKFLENHVSQEHNDMIPREMPVAQYIFNLKNKKEHGNCVICKKPTLWNEKINKYHRFCSDKCKEVYIKEARARLMRVYGTDNLAKDPEHQKKMLENRKISKKYTFSDGGVINCVGSYEYDFIKYCDEVLGLGSKDIIDPSHSDILFRYEFENKERFYIPDYYLPDYNLLVELKDAGDNNHPNIKMHMKAMDNEKFRAVIESNKYNFITICGKDYSKFVELIDYLKSKSLNEKSDDKLIISIDQNVYKQYGLTSNF